MIGVLSDPRLCKRLNGGSVKDCICKLPNKSGWLECPPEAQTPMGIMPELKPPGGEFAILEKAEKLKVAKSMGFTGDICPECLGFEIVRTGTCLFCVSCGKSVGGCS